MLYYAKLMQSRWSLDVVKILFRSSGWVNGWLGGGMEIKATSAKVEVEVEAELGNSSIQQ